MIALGSGQRNGARPNHTIFLSAIWFFDSLRLPSRRRRFFLPLFSQPVYPEKTEKRIARKVLQYFVKYGILAMPNKLNRCTVMRYVFFLENICFWRIHIFEFGKNANSIYVYVHTSYCIKFVWRQSGFAFFMRWLRLAHFLCMTGMSSDCGESPQGA